MKRWVPEDFDVQSLSARNRAAWATQEAKRSADKLAQNLKLLQAAPPAAPGKANSADGSQGCSAAASTGPIYPLVALCGAAGLPLPIPEYQFHPVRKWRFDYAFVLRMVAVEIEGGVWTAGRHTRGSGFVKDMQKYNAACLLGWRVLRYTPDQLGQAISDLRVMFAEESE